MFDKNSIGLIYFRLGRSKLRWLFSIFNRDDCDIHRYFLAILENVVISLTGSDLNHMFPRNICEYHSHPCWKLKKANVVGHWNTNVRNFGYCRICPNPLMFLQGVFEDYMVVSCDIYSLCWDICNCNWFHCLYTNSARTHKA